MKKLLLSLVILLISLASFSQGTHSYYKCEKNVTASFNSKTGEYDLSEVRDNVLTFAITVECLHVIQGERENMISLDKTSVTSETDKTDGTLTVKSKGKFKNGTDVVVLFVFQGDRLTAVSIANADLSEAMTFGALTYLGEK